MNNGESTYDVYSGISFEDIMALDTDGESSYSRELDSYIERCEHLLGGSEFGTSLGLRRISETDPETYKKLANIVQEVTGRYTRAIMRAKQKSTKKYISNVVVYRDDQHRQRILQKLRRDLLGYPGDIFIWTDEGDHIHIVHDCAFSNGTCRCRVLEGEDFRTGTRKPLRRIKRIQELDEIDWTNVIIYFVLGKWSSETQVWLNGRLQRPPSPSEIVQWQRVQGEWKGLVERGNAALGHNLGGETSDYEDGGQHISTGIQTSATKRRRTDRPVPAKRTKFEKISEAVGQLLTKYYPIPALHIKDILTHEDSVKFLYDPSNQKYFEAACQYYTQKYNKNSFFDFYKLYNGIQPVFFANDCDPFTYYHDRETSLKFINDLLLYQYHDNIDEIKHLLENTRDWFNRLGWERNPKCNALCIIGPPNSGKNYFWDMISAISLNVGVIGRVNNKTNQFALQEAYSRRLVMGNEISMEDGAKEDFKKLCEGTAFNIRVKFQGDKIFTKAPVLLISNYMLDICTDHHFKDIRLHTIKWNTCNLLKDSNKKPYPLCIFDLFNMYDISIQ